LLSFTAAVLGGIGNLTGATLGALVLGLIAALSDRFLEAKWTTVIVFGILILVLVFRPTGLMAEKQSERA
jgi:branched-chain amino acid transport system permease protein